MRRALRFFAAAWTLRAIYGHQDWLCSIDRAAMLADYDRNRGAA